MKKVLFFIIIMLTFDANAGGNTQQVKISTIYVNNYWTMVHAPELSDNPDNCPSSTYYAIVPTDPNYSAMHGTLLAAQLAGKSVRFYVSGCTGQGKKYPRIVSIWIKS